MAEKWDILRINGFLDLPIVRNFEVQKHSNPEGQRVRESPLVSTGL
jgi:hypothetical protein